MIDTIHQVTHMVIVRYRSPERLVKGTFQSDDSELDEDQASTPREKCFEKVRLQDEERGVPSLHRGWRTPDPSPLRNEGEPLPRCKAPMWVADAMPDEAVRGRSRTGDCSPALSSTETTSAWSRIRTPSPEVAYRPAQEAVVHTQLPLHGLPVADSNFESQQVMICIPCDADGMLLSKGSIGHPYTCGEACKYASKPRGCKDGLACDRCHLCDWKRKAAVPPPPRPVAQRKGGFRRKRVQSQAAA